MQQSLQNSACLGQHQGGLPISDGVVADPAVAGQADAEALPPTPPAFAIRVLKVLPTTARRWAQTFETAGYGLAGHFIAGNSTKAQREAS